MSSTEELTWAHIFVRVGLNACTHPIEYAKVLIQIGHEPLPPYRSRTILRTDALYYPSIFSYIKYIKRTDGLSGCFRGLTPRLTGNIVNGVVFQQVVEHFPIENDSKPTENLSLEQHTERFLKRTARESLARTVGIIASHPFHVIAVRSMAEFVGHDGVYTGMFTSIGVIVKNDGISGFFSGLIPRVLCDLGALWLSNVIIHYLNTYLIEDKDVKSYIAACVKFLASSFTYPLHVVSTCMAVSDSGIRAGSPPLMPVYSSWVDCWGHLKATKGLKRGSSILWRRYTGPKMIMGDLMNSAMPIYANNLQ